MATFEDWLHATCPSGDVESVQYQWVTSSAYADFHEPLGASEPSPPTPVEGGWVLWHGGPTPYFNGKVRVKFADGFDTTSKEKWSDRAWAQEHIGRDADCNIVAFSWY
jgi:hypothetical protein